GPDPAWRQQQRRRDASERAALRDAAPAWCRADGLQELRRPYALDAGGSGNQQSVRLVHSRWQRRTAVAAGAAPRALFRWLEAGGGLALPSARRHPLDADALSERPLPMTVQSTRFRWGFPPDSGNPAPDRATDGAA